MKGRPLQLVRLEKIRISFINKCGFFVKIELGTIPSRETLLNIAYKTAWNGEKEKLHCTLS